MESIEQWKEQIKVLINDKIEAKYYFYDSVIKVVKRMKKELKKTESKKKKTKKKK